MSKSISKNDLDLKSIEDYSPRQLQIIKSQQRFKDGMEVIRLITNVIRDSNEREKVRIREINKLCLDVEDMLNSKF